MKNNYNKIFDNGIKHIDVAKKIAEKEIYGMAISHLVLAIEEFIKFQIMLDYLNGAKIFNEAEVKEIFKSHTAKHKFIEEFQNSTTKEHQDNYHQALLNIVKSNGVITEFELNVFKNKFTMPGSFLRTAYKEIVMNDEERDQFLNWLTKANQIKQKGFYVNYQNSTWEIPDELKKDDYELALKYTLIIKNQTEVVKSLDTDDDGLMEFLNQKI